MVGKTIEPLCNYFWGAHCPTGPLIRHANWPPGVMVRVPGSPQKKQLIWHHNRQNLIFKFARKIVKVLTIIQPHTDVNLIYIWQIWCLMESDRVFREFSCFHLHSTAQSQCILFRLDLVYVSKVSLSKDTHGHTADWAHNQLISSKNEWMNLSGDQIWLLRGSIELINKYWHTVLL